MGNRLSVNSKNGKRKIRDYVINDEEIDRLQVQHHIFRTIWEGNFKAPVEKVLESDNAEVLDIGCGTGIWACDLISDFPRCHITGIDSNPDLFPYQPPRNVKFHCANDYIQALSTFKDNSFDYLHMRFCWSHFTRDQWRNVVLSELMRVIKPGGWLEIVDFSVDAQNKGPIATKYLQRIIEQSRTRNLDYEILPLLPSLLPSIPNLSPQIYHQTRLIPCGAWGGKIGAYYEKIAKSTVLKTTETMSRRQGHDVAKIIEDLSAEFRSYRTSAICHRIFAQKAVTEINTKFT
ncbi:3488_t:CDS:2 [Acaulospora colombiana]|uniref:3488_t:CDS:1 n=1 Tax=Acaulospora colombiana TaxID=27376 RepID=A0ACA9MR09_9GLOM|nr:3488_t:CDS:2 [Acaulospora colombiana]